MPAADPRDHAVVRSSLRTRAGPWRDHRTARSTRTEPAPTSASRTSVRSPVSAMLDARRCQPSSTRSRGRGRARPGALPCDPERDAGGDDHLEVADVDARRDARLARRAARASREVELAACRCRARSRAASSLHARDGVGRGRRSRRPRWTWKTAGVIAAATSDERDERRRGRSRSVEEPAGGGGSPAAASVYGLGASVLGRGSGSPCRVSQRISAAREQRAATTTSPCGQSDMLERSDGDRDAREPEPDQRPGPVAALPERRGSRSSPPGPRRASRAPRPRRSGSRPRRAARARRTRRGRRRGGCRSTARGPPATPATIRSERERCEEPCSRDVGRVFAHGSRMRCARPRNHPE